MSDNKIDVAYSIYESFDKGDQAEIRRGNISEPFWRIVGRVDDYDLDYWKSQKWKMLLQAIAISGGHTNNIPFGKALAKSNFSKPRVKRFLNCREEDLEDYLLPMARYLSSKNQKANWNTIYWLLFGDSERAKFDISKDYFLNN